MAMIVLYVIVYNKILNAFTKRLFWITSFTFFVLTITLFVVNFYISFGGFGPGAAFFCVSLLAVPVTVFILFTKNPLKKEVSEISNNSKKYLFSIRLLFVFLQVLPLPAWKFVVGTCNSYHDEQAIPLIVAIENYFGDNGEYPNNLEALIPKYASVTPEPFCLEPYHWFFDTEGTNIKLNFYLLDCAEKKVLAVQDTSLGWLRRYDFEKDKWSASDAFDGYCSYLD